MVAEAANNQITLSETKSESMRDLIHSLDDASIVRILRFFSSGDTRGIETELSEELRHALQEEFAIILLPTPPSDAELARAALLVLAENPRMSERIKTIAGTAWHGMSGVDSAGIVVAALVVLQTRVRIERVQNGRWKFLIEKTAIGNPQFKALLEKLISYLP